MSLDPGNRSSNIKRQSKGSPRMTDRYIGRLRKWPVKTGTKVHRVPKESSPEEEQETMRCSDKFDPVKILLRDKSKSKWTTIAKKIEKKYQFHATNFSKNEK